MRKALTILTCFAVFAAAAICFLQYAKAEPVTSLTLLLVGGLYIERIIVK